MANVFLAWVIGADDLWTIITDPPAQHLTGLVAITIFSLVFYGVFARFREQACTLACPYGRVMSALIDTHTRTVTYDRRRGEPRAHVATARRAPGDDQTPPPGDCVDCAQCVTVCPTGIDIRNGIQLECINCAACIDACDDVMTRLGRPRGLIRITSEEAVRIGAGRWLTARVKAYAAIWLVLIGTAATLIASRPDLDVLILRQPGTLFTELPGDAIGNFYNVQVVNRTAERHVLTFRAIAPDGATITELGDIHDARPHGLVEGRLLLSVPAARLSGPASRVTFEILADGQRLDVIESSFLGPGKRP
jgi:cytochrome c oxidase accessory protein FixG